MAKLLRPVWQVYKRLSDPEFVCLKGDIAVCKGQAVECFAVRSFNEHGCQKREVWIGSGASDWSDLKETGDNNNGHAHTSQLSRLDLNSMDPKVFSSNHCLIVIYNMCICIFKKRYALRTCA